MGTGGRSRRARGAGIRGGDEQRYDGGDCGDDGAGAKRAKGGPSGCAAVLDVVCPTSVVGGPPVTVWPTVTGRMFGCTSRAGTEWIEARCRQHAPLDNVVAGFTLKVWQDVMKLSP